MPASPSPAPARQLTMFQYAAVLGFVTLAAPLGMNMYVPALPEIATALGTDAGRVQLSLVSFLIALAGGQLFYGALSDRFGRKLPLACGLILFVAASIGASLSVTVEQFIGWRFAQGLGACAAQAIPRAMVRDLHTGPSAARLMGFVLLVISVAPLLAPLAGSGLVAFLPWGSIFWFMAFAGALAFALVLLCLPETLPPEQRVKGGFTDLMSEFRLLLGHRQLLLLTLTISFGQASFFAYLGGSAFIFVSLLGLNPWQYSIAYGTAAASWAAAAQAASPLIARFGEGYTARTAALAAAAAAISLLIVALAGAIGLWTMVLGVVTLFAALGVLTPVVTIVALHPHGRSAGMASAMIGMFTFGAGAAASALVGAFSNGTAIPMCAVMGGCTALALVACVLGLPSHGSKREA